MEILPNPNILSNNAREEARQALFHSLEHPVSRFCIFCGAKLILRKAKWLCESDQCRGRIIETCCD
jgi:hypothetical protein